MFVQANPPNQDNFPFVVLGNKTDLDGGKQRVVRCFLSGFQVSCVVFENCCRLIQGFTEQQGLNLI